MSWVEIFLRHGYGAILLGMGVLAARGRLVAPPVAGVDANDRTSRMLQLLGRAVAGLLWLAATTAFAPQEGWVLGVQLAAIYGLFGYIFIAGGIRLRQAIRFAKRARGDGSE